MIAILEHWISSPAIGSCYSHCHLGRSLCHDSSEIYKYYFQCAHEYWYFEARWFPYNHPTFFGHQEIGSLRDSVHVFIQNHFKHAKATWASREVTIPYGTDIQDYSRRLKSGRSYLRPFLMAIGSPNWSYHSHPVISKRWKYKETNLGFNGDPEIETCIAAVKLNDVSYRDSFLANLKLAT